MSIAVAVAVIIDKNQRILITQRPLHVPQGGCWEFPGGKLEKDEPSEAALIRELREEVGLEVSNYRLLGEINHKYSDRTVKLIIFLVTQFTGKPSCLEGQLAMKWIKQHELIPEDFPDANRKVIEMIKNFVK